MLWTLLAIGGCDALGGGATIQLDSATVRLDRGGDVHDIVVGGAGARDSIAPTMVEAQVGDAVRFTADDRRTHALAFDGDRLEPAARQFLESTLQRLGPPLVDEGAAWVVSFAEAPPGRYPFVCRTHGARGVVVVEPED